MNVIAEIEKGELAVNVINLPYFHSTDDMITATNGEATQELLRLAKLGAAVEKQLKSADDLATYLKGLFDSYDLQRGYGRPVEDKCKNQYYKGKEVYDKYCRLRRSNNGMD